MTARRYYPVAFDDGLIANDSLEAVGILVNKPDQGQFASIGVFGVMKYHAGLAVNSEGYRLRVTTSGYMVPCDSGYYSIGRALDTVTSGSIGRGFFNFATPVYMVSSK
ncbi:MAG: hypothetical protein JRJ77_03925 [Deltaproteobacteria bacterium]|nr:hypothetical protein [Deltaproteobacteria bacterium]